jgi:hypothetical protein
MPSAVAYYRVSTQRQGRSGLGIEAQRAAVARFAEAEGIAVIQEFTEVETGKGADALDRRPQLTAALALARQAKCPVVVAKLDRLSRDVAFIAGLMVQRVPFIVAERYRCAKLTDLPRPCCRSSPPFSAPASPACVAWQSPSTTAASAQRGMASGRCPTSATSWRGNLLRTCFYRRDFAAHGRFVGWRCKSQCEMRKGSVDQGYIAIGSPGFVAGAGLGNALGNAIAEDQYMKNCLIISGWKRAPHGKGAAAGSAVAPGR